MEREPDLLLLDIAHVGIMVKRNGFCFFVWGRTKEREWGRKEEKTMGEVKLFSGPLAAFAFFIYKNSESLA